MKKVLIMFFLLTSTSTVFAQKTFKFTIEGMTCQGCANTATQALQKMDGVDSVSVDLASKQAFVLAENGLAEKDLKAILENETNFEALFEGERLPQPLTEKEKEGLDIKTIKGGGKIKFREHVAPDKITIFDFYADWCGPCKIYSPKVERLLLEHDDLALRKVDVVDWKSALARQLTKEYKLPALPFTLIFDEKGNLLGRIEGNDIERVKAVIQNQ